MASTAKTIFERLSPYYDRVLDYATLFQDRYWKSWLIRELPPRRDWRVLDLGCGTGVLEKDLCRMGYEVVGVDLTEAMLRVAAEKRLGCVGGLVAGDAERMPVREGTFDAVVSCYVAKYCNLDVLLAEARRCLNRGGKLTLYDFTSPQGYFAIFHAFYLYGLLRLVGRVVERTSPGLAFTFKNLPTIVSVRRWDESIEKRLIRHGFSNIRKKRLSGGVVTALSATLGLD